MGEVVNPYRTLGIKKSATADEIRIAHRRAVMRHHPDRGGDREKFEAAQKAYEILSDPERRARYDRNGDTSDPAAGRAISEVVSFIAPILFRIIEQLADRSVVASATDLHSHVADGVDQVIKGMKEEIALLRMQVGFLYKGIGRFKAKSGEQCVLDGVMKSRLSEIEAQVARLDGDIARAIRAKEFLAECTYEHERSIGSMYGKGIWGSTDSTGFFTYS